MGKEGQKHSTQRTRRTQREAGFPEPSQRKEQAAQDDGSGGRHSHPDCKLVGEATEADFLAMACELDFAVSKPWGDSRRYDFVVECGRVFWRVQVKSASRYGERYVVKAGGNALYTAEDIDFLAAYVHEVAMWYIVPIEAFAGRATLKFHPVEGSQAKYEKYREAWCLLKCERKQRGRRDVPKQCRGARGEFRCAVCPENREKA